jgi:moderate conductance mechanosensitive channel
MPAALVAVLAVLLRGTLAEAEAPASTPSPSPAAGAESAAGTPEAAGEELSDAEILIRARALYDHDRARLQRLQQRAGELERAFDSSSERFRLLDEERKQAREARANGIKDVADEGGDPPAAPDSAEADVADLAALEHRWETARQELDFLLRRRQTVDEAKRIVDAKLAKIEEAIEVITFGHLPLDESTGSAPSTVSPPASSPGASEPSADEQPETVPTPKNGDSRPNASKLYDRRVADAELAVEDRLRELRTAERRARLVSELVLLNQQDLTLARTEADASRGQRTLLEERVEELQEELERLDQSGAPRREQALLQRRIDQTRQFVEATASAAGHNAELVATLETRLASVQGLRNAFVDRLENAEDRLDTAQRVLAFQQSPLAPHRLMRWGIEAGPRILVLLLVLIAMWAVARRLIRHIVEGTVSRSHYGSKEERLERVETLRRVFQNALTLVFFVIGAFMLLPQFGIDATVLLGSAAVLSLAVAFGAQNLVHDYFSGFMILLENQYRVGNVIQINDTSGVVEDVSLRMTTLRDLEGVAHFVPHSQIQTVSNLTHGWSRVALDVGVAYREDVDRVMAVLLELARDMRKDPQFRDMIVDDPEMLGVDSFADSAVIIKLLVRTRPLKQWIVKRELLRRIKNRFDELGIEIPFPHRTVFHRNAEP